MVGRCQYTCNPNLYDAYYQAQVGNGLPVFIGGRTSQRGNGLGNVLSGLFRSAVPLLKQTGKAILKEGAKTGLKVAGDVLSGQNVKDAASQRAREAGKRLYTQAIGQLSGNKKRKRSSSPSSAAAAYIKPRHSAVGPYKRKKKVKKRVKDIFQ